MNFNNITMKKIIGIALVALVVGCQPPAQDAEAIKTEIKENRKKTF